MPAYLYFLKDWVTPQKRVCNLYCNLCCLALPTKSWGLQYTSGCATLSKAYAGYLHLENHWVKLQLWVRHLKCSLCLLPLFSESLGYTTHGCLTVSAAYVGWLRHLKGSLCWLPLLRESLGYTSVMGVLP